MIVNDAYINRVFIKHSSPKKLIQIASKLNETGKMQAVYRRRPKVVLCLCDDAIRERTSVIEKTKGESWVERLRKGAKNYLRSISSTTPTIDVEENPAALIDLLA